MLCCELSAAVWPPAERFQIRGNLFDHEYEIFRGRDKSAEVSKKWFRLRDTYGVQIEPGADDVLLLAATGRRYLLQLVGRRWKLTPGAA